MAIVLRLEANALRLEAIALGLEAIALRLEAKALRLEAICQLVVERVGRIVSFGAMAFTSMFVG